MEPCPKCGHYSYAGGVCIDDDCNFPQIKSNNQMRRERQQADAERAKRAERHRREDRARKEQAKLEKAERKRAKRLTKGKSKSGNTPTDDWVEGLIVLAGGAGGGYLGYLNDPVQIESTLIGGGIGLAIAYATRVWVRNLLYFALFAGILYVGYLAFTDAG